jgi:hypothetical protein
MNDDAQKRFRDFVILNLEPQKILSASEERHLIGEGISQFELDGEQARGIVAVLSDQADRILESDVSRHILDVLHQLAGRRAISKRVFKQAVAILKALTKGQISDAAAKAWLKRLVEENQLPVRGRGLFRRMRWFRKIRPVN